MRRVGYRIAGTTALIFAAIAVCAGALGIVAAHMLLARTLDNAIQDAAVALVDVRRTDGREAFIGALMQRSNGRHDEIGYALFDASGAIVLGRLDIDRPAPGWHDTHFYDPVEGEDPARILAVRLPGHETLVVGGDRRPIALANTAILWLFSGSVVVMLLLCAIMAAVLGRYLQGRLTPIIATSDAVIAGDLTRRIPVRDSGDEFDRIALSINAMLDRVADLVRGLRRVSADVAHDLRTPLARMRARTEHALIVHPEVTPHRAALERGIEQIDEVLATFDAMLRIAELEEGGGGVLCERVDLDALAVEMGQTFVPVFAAEHRALVVRAGSGSVACGDRALIASAIANLLENVLQHTSTGVGATLEIAATPEAVAISVRDAGPGVAATALERIFERHYRADAARGGGGRGLGLSLVAAIAQAHQGTVCASNLSPGLQITMTLPKRNVCSK